MEFAHSGDAPVWVDYLAKILKDKGKVGLLSFRDNSARRDDFSPAVYIGCSSGRNGSSNYSTVVSDLLYSMSSVDKKVVTIPCDTSTYEGYGRILPSYIVGKYYIGYNTLTAIVCGGSVLAICDVDKREIFMPDVSPEIEWAGDTEANVDITSHLISDIIDIMEVRHFDDLFMDIEAASRNSAHVNLIEVKAETTFDKDVFISSCMDALKTYEATLEGSYRTLFNDMKQDLNIAKGKGIVDALELIAFMKTKHFVFVSHNTLKYTGGRIVANTGIYNDSLYNTQSELWISGLRVVIDDGIVVDATCYRAYHPNCSGRRVCLGELAGIPVRDVHKIVESLNVPNFSNGYWSGSSEYLGDKIINLEGASEQVWSSDD